MTRLRLCILTMAICLFAGGVIASESSNLCFTQPQYQCSSDIEWEVGYFWANHTPSAESCAHYFAHFEIGDIWGMCDGFSIAGAAYGESQQDIERAFQLTSRWHTLPRDESSACPFEGLDPIINYEDGTYICATSF